MYRAKRGVRICVLCVVVTAIVVGVFYYYSEVQNHALHGDGTLVSAIGNDWSILWE